MDQVSKRHFVEILNRGIPRHENARWCRAIKLEYNDVHEVIDLSCKLYASTREADAYQKRGADQWRELRSLPVILTTLVGLGVGGLFMRYRLPYLGSVIALAGPVFVIGGVARVVISMRARESARAEAAQYEKRLQEELLVLELPAYLRTGGYRFVEAGEKSLKLEMREEGAPSIWSSAHPYVKRTSEFLTIVGFVGACLEMAGYTQMGKIVNFTRALGLVSIFASSAANGLYDTEISSKERAARAVLFSAFLSIVGCRAYQELTGVVFGDYQFVWNLVSQGQYYGYLLWIEGRAGYSLWKAAKNSARLGDVLEKKTQKGMDASVIGKLPDSDDYDKHLALARYMQMLADARESKISTGRGLLDLVRPGLELLGLISVVGMAHNSLRLTEGVVGLGAIWMAHQKSEQTNKETVAYIRSRLDRYVHDDFADMVQKGWLERRNASLTDEQILDLHLECLGLESMEQVATLVKRVEAAEERSAT